VISALIFSEGRTKAGSAQNGAWPLRRKAITWWKITCPYQFWYQSP